MLGMVTPHPLNFRRTRESIPFGRLQLSCSIQMRGSGDGVSTPRLHPAAYSHRVRGLTLARWHTAGCSHAPLTLTEIFLSLWWRLKRAVRLCKLFTFTSGATIVPPAREDPG